MAPAKPGLLYGEGQVIQLGKNIGYLDANLMDASGALIACATSSARLVNAARLPR
jgi:acyl-coenzyme A thioesterase PaaI-like protein